MARTLVKPQAELSEFLDAFARHMVKRSLNESVIRALGGMHLTILESAGMAPLLKQKGYNPPEVRRFSATLQQRLNDVQGTQDGIVAEVDQDRPFRWLGWRENQLVLNMRPNPAIRRERALIEVFLREHLGVVPSLRDLDEHISIGAIHPQAISRQEYRNPADLLPSGVIVPQYVALNGLMVFLNGIGDAATL